LPSPSLGTQKQLFSISNIQYILRCLLQMLVAVIVDELVCYNTWRWDVNVIKMQMSRFLEQIGIHTSCFSHAGTMFVGLWIRHTLFVVLVMTNQLLETLMR
jgi:hypothetical protein